MKNDEVNKRDLYICHTLIHILRACANHSENSNKGDIVISDSIYEFEPLEERLRNSGLWDNVIVFRDAYIEQKYYYFIRSEKLRRDPKIFKVFISLIGKIKLSEYDDIYIFNDLMLLGRYLRVCKRPYHLIEDGLDTMLNWDYNRGLVADIDESIYGTYDTLKYVIDFEVNSANTLPKNLPVKVKERSFVLSINSFSEEVMEKIETIFIEKSVCEEIRKVLEKDKDKVVIMTQPFWEFNRNANYFINAYNEIAEFFVSKNYDVIIKPHPRDHNEYISNDDIKQISGGFPIELLFLKYNVDRIKYVCACNSTARYLFKYANKNITLIDIPVDCFLGDDWNIDYVKELFNEKSIDNGE